MRGNYRPVLRALFRGFSHSHSAKSMNPRVQKNSCGSIKKKARNESGLSRSIELSYRLKAGAILCSATIFLALSAKAFACGRSSSPLTTSGSDSARTFIPSS